MSRNEIKRIGVGSASNYRAKRPNGIAKRKNPATPMASREVSTSNYNRYSSGSDAPISFTNIAAGALGTMAVNTAIEMMFDKFAAIRAVTLAQKGTPVNPKVELEGARRVNTYAIPFTDLVFAYGLHRENHPNLAKGATLGGVIQFGTQMYMNRKIDDLKPDNDQ